MSGEAASTPRIAVLSDIHGNLPALEAVLRDVRAAGVERLIVAGDVLVGPLSRETLALLLSLDPPVQFLQGNVEVAVLAVAAGDDPGPMPESAREMVRWTARQHTAEELRLVASWPKSLRLQVAGLGSVHVCHGTPRHENEIFTRLTREERLRPLFDGLGADLVVCGHTHMPFDRRVGSTRVVNAGSVGMPFGRPGADWLLLGPDVRPQHADFDLAAAAARLRATTFPDAGDFVERYVLHPPTEEAMLAAYARAELRYSA